MQNPKDILSQSHNIAVLGVNQDPESFANKIVRKIRSLDKQAFPINPKYSTLFDESVYPSIEDCPLVPDLVVFVVNPHIGIHYLETVVKLGIKHIWLQPGTISEELLAKAHDLELNVTEACVLVVGNYL